MAAKKSPARRMPNPPVPKPPTPTTTIPRGLAQALPKKEKPKTGGQRGSAPRPEEYPRDNPGYPKTPGRVYPKGTPYKPRTQEPGRPKPGVVRPKRKPPVTTTTTVPKTPGVAQALPKKRK
tara:strand:+ start:179 stop:541 length:363 start_codon:yes stop_codon:yes gene_type:complete